VPRIGQGGKKVYNAIVALQKHLHNACSATKVTVYLEWRVRAEEVGICATIRATLGKGGLEE
jgi:hypothetical protein